MFCAKCGKRLADGALFCSFCGAEVVPPAEEIDAIGIEVLSGSEVTDGDQVVVLADEQKIGEHQEKANIAGVASIGASTFSIYDSYKRSKNGEKGSLKYSFLAGGLGLYGTYHNEYAQALREGASEEEAKLRAKNKVIKALKVIGIVIAIGILIMIIATVIPLISEGHRSSVADSDSSSVSQEVPSVSESTPSDSSESEDTDSDQPVAGIAPAGYEQYKDYMCEAGNSGQLTPCTSVKQSMDDGIMQNLPFGVANSPTPNNPNSFIPVDENQNGKIDDVEYGMSSSSASGSLPWCPQQPSDYTEDLFTTGCVFDSGSTISGDELRKEYEAYVN